MTAPGRVFPHKPAINVRLATAIAVAFFALLFFSWQILSISQEEVSQFDKYLNAAQKYLNGTLAPERTLDYSPLYLWLNVLIYRFFEAPVKPLLLIQVLFLALTANLLYLVLRRHFGLYLSLAGALFFLLGQSVIIYGYVLEPEPLMMFFLVAVVYFGGATGLRNNFLTGLSLTLCLLTRPSFAPLIVLVPFYYGLRSGGLRKALPAITVFFVPLVIGLCVISVRNYRLQGDFSLSIMNPGTLFFYGNNPQSAGTAVAYPPVVQDMADYYTQESDYHHAVVRLLALRTAGGQPVRETNRALLRNTLNYIEDYPLRFLSLTAHRLFYIFNGYRWHDLDVAWSVEQRLKAGFMPFVPFSLLSALALSGLVTGLKNWREYFLYYTVFLNQIALMSVTLTTDRQRVCIYTFFVFFAVAALSRMTPAKRNWKTIVAFSVPLALLFSFETGLMGDNQHSLNSAVRVPGLVSEAERQQRSGDFSASAQTFARALALGPWTFQNGKPSDLPIRQDELYGLAAGELSREGETSPSAGFDRALLLIEAKRFDEAVKILVSLEKKGYVFSPDNDRIPDPLYHLGRIELLRGDPEKAADYMRQSLIRNPGEPAALAQLACLTNNETYAESLFRYFDEMDARFFLGRACVENGNYSRAADYLGRLVILLPEYARGRIFLAAALGGLGKYADAGNLYLATTGEHPRTVMLEDLIVPIFRRWAEDGPAEAVYWYGTVLRQYGHFREAMPYLRQAEKAGHTGAAEELRLLQDILNRAEPRITPPS